MWLHLTRGYHGKNKLEITLLEDVSTQFSVYLEKLLLKRFLTKFFLYESIKINPLAPLHSEFMIWTNLYVCYPRMLPVKQPLIWPNGFLNELYPTLRDPNLKKKIIYTTWEWFRVSLSLSGLKVYDIFLKLPYYSVYSKVKIPPTLLVQIMIWTNLNLKLHFFFFIIPLFKERMAILLNKF